MCEIILAAVLAASRPQETLEAQTSDPQGDFRREQMAAFLKVVVDPTARARAESIWLELYRYTGVAIPVYPAQQFTIGQALPNGAILLDVSILAYPRSVTAFWMAHEYGHHMLGHSQLYSSRLGQLIVATAEKQHEDDADAFGAKFIRDNGYSPENVIKFLCRLPGDPSHSSGPERAATVANVFGREDNGSSCSEHASDDRSPPVRDPAGAEQRARDLLDRIQARKDSIADTYAPLGTAIPRLLRLAQSNFASIRGKQFSKEPTVLAYANLNLEGWKYCLITGGPPPEQSVYRCSQPVGSAALDSAFIETRTQIRSLIPKSWTIVSDEPGNFEAVAGNYWPGISLTKSRPNDLYI